MRLSEHFDSDEFRCHCGCDYRNYGEWVDIELVNLLERIRHRLGDIPLEITSGVRCPKHNRDIGGVKDSRHVKGDAADIACPMGMDTTTLASIAEEEGANGIGVYSDFVHVDMRGYDARW